MNGIRPAACFLATALLVLSFSSSAQCAEDEKVSLSLLKRQPVEVSPSDDELTQALTNRSNAASRELASTYALYLSGRATLDIFYESGKRVTKSGLELFTSPAEKIELLEQWVALSDDMERAVTARYESGTEPIATLEQAKYFAA